MVKTDADLMQAFQEGDRESFEKLVLRHQMGVFNFFMRMLSGDRAAAEDMTQEVFFRIFLHAGNYERTAKFTTYLYRIAKNCWIDHLRRIKRRGVPRSLDKEMAEGFTLHDQLESDADDPGRRLESDDRRRIIEEALESLPEEQRVVFVLSEVQGMKYAEIGETLQIPVGTVKSRMHTAVQRLRDALERRGIVGE